LVPSTCVSTRSRWDSAHAVLASVPDPVCVCARSRPSCRLRFDMISICWRIGLSWCCRHFRLLFDGALVVTQIHLRVCTCGFFGL
ncbi:unnamed protein product, partial [Amoebophrya sp. A120]